MLIVGYFLAILIGLILGLIGGGGSMLTLPLLVYIFGVDAVSATGYTMFIVGVTSAVGSYAYIKNGMVDIRKAMAFGIPSMLVVILTRNFFVPLIPEVVFHYNSFQLTKPDFIMLLFAALMVAASFSMMRKPKSVVTAVSDPMEMKMIILNGIVVGLVSGFVGAGGGFLIIPALVLFSKLPMKQAIGTSLMIITANSMVGFIGELGNHNMNWNLLISVTGATVIGIFVGTKVSKRIDGAKLKPIFGWFVLVMGIYIVLKQTLLK
jgi:uncharacterized membrane protein YfcA